MTLRAREAIKEAGVTRVFSPGDVGALTKPFVFLDYFDFVPDGKGMFPMHPRSGITTTTILLSGSMRYDDTTGGLSEVCREVCQLCGSVRSRHR